VANQKLYTDFSVDASMLGRSTHVLGEQVAEHIDGAAVDARSPDERIINRPWHLRATVESLAAVFADCVEAASLLSGTPAHTVHIVGGSARTGFCARVSPTAWASQWSPALSKRPQSATC
jgi:sugar (pentulose or hexulose) kinase